MKTASFWTYAGLYIGIRSLWKMRRGHASKIDAWLHSITAETRQLPHFHGNVVGPRIDFRRVAPSRLLEVSCAYINPYRALNEAVFYFRLGFLCFSVD